MSSFFGRIQFNSPLSEKVVSDLANTLKNSLCEKQLTTTPNIKTFLGLNLRYITPESVNEQIHYPQWPHIYITAISRLDNREELSQLLTISNQNAPDSEFIAQAYLKWGLDCMHHLKGDFAVVLHDASQDSTHYFLSPLSPFSILYKKTDTAFLYASTYKELATQLEETPTINQRRIIDHFSGSDTYPNEIFYNGITVLLPGHILSVKNKVLSLKQYWSVDDIGQKKIRYKNTDDYYDHIGEVFNTAVKRRLRSHYPIASHLSGGLDSSSVSALAAIELKKQNKNLHSYISYSTPEKSLSLEKNSIDDRYLAYDLVKKYPNIQLRELPISDDLSFEKVGTLLAKMGFFPRNVHNIGWMVSIYRLGGNLGARTFLTGENGNLTISWNGISQTKIRILKNKIRAAQAKIKKFISPSAWVKESLFTQEIINSLNIKPPPFYYHPACSLRHGINTIYTHHAAQASVINQTYLQDYGLMISDPTADLDLLNVLLSCPAHVFNNNKESRLAIKKAMVHILPNSLLINTTKGIQNAEFMYKLLQEKENMLKYIQESTPSIINTEKAIKILNRLDTLDMNQKILDTNLLSDLQRKISGIYSLRKMNLIP